MYTDLKRYVDLIWIATQHHDIGPYISQFEDIKVMILTAYPLG